MLKKKALKRIFVTTLSFGIVLLVCLLTNKNEVVVYDDVYYINDTETKKVYTKTMDNLVALATIYADDKEKIEDKVKSILETIIEKNDKNSLLPDYFRPILPANTKILSVELNNDVLKVNFSKELLNVKLEDSNEMIESIVYTLTEFDEVLGVSILVEGKTLKYIPNTKSTLKEVITRDYGINKIYDITSSSDFEVVTLYYLTGSDNLYYAPVTKYLNSKEEKLEIIVEELSNRYNLNKNLKSFLNDGLEILNYKIMENKIIIDFNDKIYENKSSKEVNSNAINSIVYSVFASYDIDNIEIYGENNKILEKSRKDIEN